MGRQRDAGSHFAVLAAGWRSRRFRTWCLLVASGLGCWWVSACSDVNAPAAKEEQAEARLAVARVHLAYCQRFPGCLGLLAYPDPQMCLQAPIMDASLRNIGDELLAYAAGQMAFHREHVEACVAELGPPTCQKDRYLEMPAACAKIFTSVLKEGDACVWMGCGPEHFCSGSSTELGCGVCTARLVVGAGCSPNRSDCVAEAYCSDKGFCEPKWPRVHAGEACTIDEYGDDCEKSLNCLMLPGESTATCAPLQPVGGPCTNTDGCPADSRCERPMGAASGTCRAKGKVGQPCAMGDQLFTFGATCQTGLACEPTATDAATGTCQPIVVGMRCNPDRGCPTFGWACRKAPDGLDRCQPPPGLGEQCGLRDKPDPWLNWAADRCQLGLACDPQTLHCIAGPPIGQPCVNLSCALGSWCELTSPNSATGTCRPAPAAVGDRCNPWYLDGLGGRCPFGLGCSEAGICAEPLCKAPGK